MNYPCLILLFVLIFFTIVAFVEGWLEGFIGAVGTGLSLALVLLISLTPMGSSFCTNYPAESERFGDEIVVRAKYCPTQIVTDLKFLDKKLYIEKQEINNGWGLHVETRFSVGIEEKQQQTNE